MPELRSRISFGTDGWRAIIADGFTFESVRLVARAMAMAARRIEAPADVDQGAIVVGYDRRFLSKEFAFEVAAEISRSGFRVLMADRPTPSQTVSHAVVSRKVIGGVVVTASHNPPHYNGLKFKGWYGGSAVPAIYEEIERNLGKEESSGMGLIKEVDLLTPYVDAVRHEVDVDLIRDSGMRIVHDPIHGVAAGIPAMILGDHPPVETLRGETNPSFGGVNPEPIPENIEKAVLHMRLASSRGRDRRPDLAICNDGDADRLGILDERGDYVTPHKVISLLALDLIRRKGKKGEIVKTFSTTRMIEEIGRKLEVEVHETPIGFKYVADLMLSRDIVIGGEESGGIGFGSFLPERDGILSGLKVAECVAAHGRPLSELVQEMEEEFGAVEYGRRDIRTDSDRIDRLLDRLTAGELDSSFGVDLDRREDVDGVKLSLADRSWILFRKSGTEPLVRIYCEAATKERVGEMLEIAAREL